MTPDIIIDATHLGAKGGTGVENYVHHLLPLLSEELIKAGWQVRWVGHEAKSPVKLPKGVDWIHSPHSFYWSQTALSRLLQLQKPDVFFTPSGIPPVLYGGKTAVTVHDMSAYLAPEVFSRGQKFRLRTLMKHAVSKASVILTPSEHSKIQISKYWHIKPEKISVTPLSYDEIAVKPEVLKGIDPTQPILLSLGRVETKKNIGRLIEMFMALGHKTAQLVLAGKDGVGAEQIKAQVAALPAEVQERIILPGYVTDAQREWLFQHASVFLVSGALEGFSLPLLEAFTHGVPALAAKAGPLPEVGGDACLYANPEQTKEWVAALKKLLDDKKLAEELRKKGKEQVKLFTWEKTAKETAKALMK